MQKGMEKRDVLGGSEGTVSGREEAGTRICQVSLTGLRSNTIVIGSTVTVPCLYSQCRSTRAHPSSLVAPSHSLQHIGKQVQQNLPFPLPSRSFICRRVTIPPSGRGAWGRRARHAERLGHYVRDPGSNTLSSLSSCRASLGRQFNSPRPIQRLRFGCCESVSLLLTLTRIEEGSKDTQII